MRRPARRYLVFRIMSDDSFSSERISTEIERSLRRLFGDIGVLHSFPRLVSYDPTKMMGVLRCSAAWLVKVRASIALITQIDGHLVGFFVLKSSGTVASLRRSLDPTDAWIGRRHQHGVSSRRK